MDREKVDMDPEQIHMNGKSGQMNLELIDMILLSIHIAAANNRHNCESDQMIRMNNYLNRKSTNLGDQETGFRSRRILEGVDVAALFGVAVEGEMDQTQKTKESREKRTKTRGNPP